MKDRPKQISSILHADWIYSAHLLLNAAALSLGYIVWTVPDVIALGLDSRLLKILLLNALMGLLFGLLIGIYQFFMNLNRKRELLMQETRNPWSAAADSRIS